MWRFSYLFWIMGLFMLGRSVFFLREQSFSRSQTSKNSDSIVLHSFYMKRTCNVVCIKNKIYVSEKWWTPQEQNLLKLKLREITWIEGFQIHELTVMIWYLGHHNPFNCFYGILQKKIITCQFTSNHSWRYSKTFYVLFHWYGSELFV